MKLLIKLEKLKPLMERLYFTAKEARKYGVHPSVLAYYIREGILTRLSRGVYQNPKFESKIDFQWEDLVITAQTIPNGVVCLISALAIYDLTEEIPQEHWIAVPNEHRASKRPKTRVTRMRNIKLGKTTIKMGDQKIAIFDRERTIIDSFRYLTKEIAIKALREGFKERGPRKLDLKKLRNYAKKLRFNIDSYILTMSI